MTMATTASSGEYREKVRSPDTRISSHAPTKKTSIARSVSCHQERPAFSEWPEQGVEQRHGGLTR